VPLSQSTSPANQKCFEILSIIISSKDKKIEESIRWLDPLPNTSQFSAIRKVLIQEKQKDRERKYRNVLRS
jgi:hypothetical protein